MYPRYKKIIWRYVRIFIDTAVAAFLIEAGLPQDLEQYKGWATIALAAGLAAVFKAIRESAGLDYDKLVHKLPL